MKKIYVCSKVVGDEAMNTAKAYRYARFVATKCGQIPICPQIYFHEILMWSKMDPQYIKQASMELLRGCDAFWYFGDGVTMDMVDLLLMAREMNIPTRHISDQEIEQYPVQTKNKIGGKKMKLSINHKRVLMVCVMAILLVSMLSVTAFAETGDVAGAVEATWNAAKVQIKTVVNNVVFPVIDLVLAVCFFAKVGLTYMDYRKHGQFEWTPAAILFATLVFTLTAPLYIWGIIGM